jgi:hypothetical protein
MGILSDNSDSIRIIKVYFLDQIGVYKMKIGHISRIDGNEAEIHRGDYMGIIGYRYSVNVNADYPFNYSLPHLSHTCYTLEQALEFACQPELNY